MFEHRLDFILGKECQRHDLSKVLVRATIVIILLLEFEAEIGDILTIF